MALEEKKLPYEFLARWGTDGTLIGAHVGFRSMMLRDGAPIPGMETVHDVMPVDVGLKSGFPLADIVNQLQADALSRNAVLVEENNKLRVDVARMEDELDRIGRETSDALSAKQALVEQRDQQLQAAQAAYARELDGRDREIALRDRFLSDTNAVKARLAELLDRDEKVAASVAAAAAEPA